MPLGNWNPYLPATLMDVKLMDWIDGLNAVGTTTVFRGTGHQKGCAKVDCFLILEIDLLKSAVAERGE